MTTSETEGQLRFARRAAEALRRLGDDPVGRELLVGRHAAGEDLRREIDRDRQHGKERDDACEASSSRSSR
ncbi:hypothetical protein GCM10011322_15200 [Salinarimonas ramus]|uniref:Uncharacterized protein n=1 Tax=Salinarimonas ramus TaxID=690164 RepID=A0A917Q6H8_9HYPH|nr:hypothetical protein GCM10011322_15200 [Salinarimonas ramus]